MSKIADLLGIVGSTFTIGSKSLSAGLRRLAFRSGSFLGTIDWTLTANRTITLPNASGIVLLDTTAAIAGSVVNPSGVATVDWAIPAGVRRITLVTSGVVLTLGSVVRFGTSAGILSTGYISVNANTGAATASSGADGTVGFLTPGNSHTNNACVVYTRGANNAWHMSGTIVQDKDYYYMSVGSRTLPGELTTFRYVSPATLNVGSLQLLWEF